MPVFKLYRWCQVQGALISIIDIVDDNQKSPGKDNCAPVVSYIYNPEHACKAGGTQPDSVKYFL